MSHFWPSSKLNLEIVVAEKLVLSYALSIRSLTEALLDIANESMSNQWALLLVLIVYLPLPISCGSFKKLPSYLWPTTGKAGIAVGTFQTRCFVEFVKSCHPLDRFILFLFLIFWKIHYRRMSISAGMFFLLIPEYWSWAPYLLTLPTDL